MRRTATILITCAVAVGGSVLPATAADDGAPPAAAISHRAGASSKQHQLAPLRIVIARAVPRTVAGVVPPPPRSPGVRVLTDIAPRPVLPTTFRFLPPPGPLTLRASSKAAVAAARASWGHPDDALARDWSSRTAVAIEVQVDLALRQLLPSGTPTWLQIELRRASLTAVKSTFCAGLEAVVLRPDGQVSVDMRQVLKDVLLAGPTAHLPSVLADPVNFEAWKTSMTGTVKNVSRSAWLRDDQGRPWTFDPLAYQGLVPAARHALALRAVPVRLDAYGRHVVRAAFVLQRTCYALPWR